MPRLCLDPRTASPIWKTESQCSGMEGRELLLEVTQASLLRKCPTGQRTDSGGEQLACREIKRKSRQQGFQVVTGFRGYLVPTGNSFEIVRLTCSCGFGEQHFEFLRNMSGKPNPIMGGQKQMAVFQNSHKRKVIEIYLGNMQSQDNRTTRISKRAVPGLGQWQEKPKTVLGFGKQLQRIVRGKWKHSKNYLQEES